MSETAQRKLHVRIRLVLPPALEEDYEPPPIYRRVGHLLKRHWPTVILALATLGTAVVVFGHHRAQPDRSAAARPAAAPAVLPPSPPSPVAPATLSVESQTDTSTPAEPNEPTVDDPASDSAEPAEGAPPSATPAAVETDPAPSVARVLFTTRVHKHEPTDRIERLDLSDGRPRRVYCFTEALQMRGRAVIHRWEHEGEPVAQLRFDAARSERWRVYSSKVIRNDMLGSWQVVVTDGEGTELARTGPLRVLGVSR